MISFRLFAVVSSCALLSGCADFNSAALEYSDTPIETYRDSRNNWRIFDKPTEGRLMIAPGSAKTVSGSFAPGLTLAGADTDIPKPIYQDAVEGWLKMQGRNCHVTDGYKLVRPRWEFKYSCPQTGAEDEATMIRFAPSRI